MWLSPIYPATTFQWKQIFFWRLLMSPPSSMQKWETNEHGQAGVTRHDWWSASDHWQYLTCFSTLAQYSILGSTLGILDSHCGKDDMVVMVSGGTEGNGIAAASLAFWTTQVEWYSRPWLFQPHCEWREVGGQERAGQSSGSLFSRGLREEEKEEFVCELEVLLWFSESWNS